MGSSLGLVVANSVSVKSSTSSDCTAGASSIGSLGLVSSSATGGSLIGNGDGELVLSITSISSFPCTTGFGFVSSSATGGSVMVSLMEYWIDCSDGYSDSG